MNLLKYFLTLFCYLVLANFYSLHVCAQDDVPPPVPVVDVKAEVLLESAPKPMPVSNAQGEVVEKPPKVQPQTDKMPVQESHIEQMPKIPYRQEGALPVPAKKPMPTIGEDLMVVELFSTQACSFCPKADAMMRNLVDQSNLIALSCHIDYFDVKDGSFSLPVCSSRQVEYESTLDAGPKYTPQMVINGRYDAIGYMMTELNQAFLQAQQAPLRKLSLEPSTEYQGMFLLGLPNMTFGKYKIWLFVYDYPKTVKVAMGANKGRDMTYYNVVSSAGYFGKWDGAGKLLTFDAKMGDNAKGFAVLVQDEATNHIIAAGKYEK